MPNSQTPETKATKYSAKEKDEETQYSYFGARYYHSDISLWLSVDPMADKYPSLSPFMYCAGNPVILVDPDGKDPIYAKNFWGKVKTIGDDGKKSTGSYLVKGSVAREVKAETKAGNFYTGNLSESKKVMHVPTGQIQQDVQQTITATINSGKTPETRVEHGGHALHGDATARIWDPGNPVQISTDANGNTTKTWSVTPFKIGGKNNQVGGPGSAIKYIWHTHPNDSEPSGDKRKGDIGVLYNLRENGYSGNPFLIDVNNGVVTYYNENGAIIKVKYSDFIKMGNQEVIK